MSVSQGTRTWNKHILNNILVPSLILSINGAIAGPTVLDPLFVDIGLVIEMTSLVLSFTILANVSGFPFVNTNNFRSKNVKIER